MVADPKVSIEKLGKIAPVTQAIAKRAQEELKDYKESINALVHLFDTSLNRL